MSHFTTCKTILRDEGCLVNALSIMGFKNVERHRQAQHLFGYGGDQRKQTAEVIIRRRYIGHLSNDLGFKRTDDGTFNAIISEFDQRRFNQTWLNELHQKYAHLAIQKKAEEMSWIKEEERVLDNGEIELVYVEPI